MSLDIKIYGICVNKQMSKIQLYETNRVYDNCKPRKS